jgi:hypothetical protein
VVRDVAGGAIAADERVRGVLARVDDVPEEVAHRVLRAGPSEVEAEAPVDERRVVLAPAVDGQPAHDEEAAPVEELRRPRAGRRPERRQRKVVASHRPDAEPAGPGGVARRLELGERARAERHRPAVRPGDLLATPGRRSTERRARDRLVRSVEVPQRLLGEREVRRVHRPLGLANKPNSAQPLPGRGGGC